MVHDPETPFSFLGRWFESRMVAAVIPKFLSAIAYCSGVRTAACLSALAKDSIVALICRGRG